MIHFQRCLAPTRLLSVMVVVIVFAAPTTRPASPADLFVDRVEIHWPDGTVEVWADVPLDRYTTLSKGGGVTATSKGPES